MIISPKHNHPPAATAAERQKAWRERQAEKGLIAVKVTVPTACAPDFAIAGALCAANPDLMLVVLRSRRTGRFVSMKGAL